MAEASVKDIAVVNTAMLDRGSSFEREPSVMDNVHKIKIYNANTYSKDPKENTIDDSLVGKFRLVKGGTQDIEYIDSGFKADILSVCKVKSGNVFVLDEFGDTIKDDKGNSKKAFFFTNEHSVYTRKTDMLGFKQMGQKPLGFFVKEDLEKMLRTKMVNGKYNPFWKQGKKKDGEPYNDTNISDTMIIYGKFIDGKYAGEFFKFVPVSTSGYGVTYKDGASVDADKGTFLYALNEGLKEWNAVRKANGKAEVKSVDPSQIDMKISFREIEIQGNRMFIPTFEYAGLTAYREDNTNDLQYILELQSEYLKEEFGLSILPNNFRLGSIQDVNISNVNEIEVKSLSSGNNSSEELDEEIEVVSIEDAEDVFKNVDNAPKTKGVVTLENGTTLVDGKEIPF